MKKTKRNVVLFCVGVLGLSTLAAALISADGGGEQHPAGLLFITSPIAVALALRVFGGDGFESAGLRANTSANWRSLLIALFTYPVLVVIALILGWTFGSVTFTDDAGANFLAAFAIALPLRGFFALCEEFGWRGYLDPQLEALGVSSWRRHLIVGTVWGSWHIPFFLAAPNTGGLALSVYIPLFLAAIFPMTVIHGVLRERTSSVWPAVVMHGIANAVAFPLLSSTVLSNQDPMLFASRPESLVILIGHALLAAVLWRFNRRASQRDLVPASPLTV